MTPRFLCHAVGMALILIAAAIAGPRTEAEEAAPIPEAFTYDPKGNRDPFIALVREGRLVGSKPGSTFDFSKPVLYGILWDPGGHSIAMINDMEVKVGDALGPYEVEEIRQDAVVLSGVGEPLVLQLDFETPSPSTTKEGERR